MYLQYKNRVASAISFVLGLIFLKAGMEKLTGVPDIIGPHDLIEELAQHNLGLYGEFISYSELVIGFLLIHDRFRTLGSIMLLPMLSNIWIVVISLNWQGTPYIVGFLLILNIILLLIDFHKIKFIFSDAEYPELSQMKLKRTHLKLDAYYLGLLGIILIGAQLGWTPLGKSVVNTGFFLIVLSMIVVKLGHLLKKKRENES